MKKFLLIPLLFLGACATTEKPDLITTRYEAIEIPASMFTCPYIESKDLPDPASLTKVQAAELLSMTRYDNKVCWNNMQALKTYYENAVEMINKKYKDKK